MFLSVQPVVDKVFCLKPKSSIKSRKHIASKHRAGKQDMYVCCNCNPVRKNLKKINHIKDPITFQQMTSKIGCSFLCKNNQKNFKSSIKSKKASHTKKIQAEKKLCFLVQLLSESNCKAQSNQGSRKPPSTRPSRESFFSVTIVRKRLKT